MAAKKAIPVRVKAGTFINKEMKNGKEVEVVYKAHEENNILFVGVAEAKELLERFVNKFEILNEIEYKPPVEEPAPEPESEDEGKEEETASGDDEDFGTEVTKSFEESKGTKCKVFAKDNLYTVIGPEGEVMKKNVSEVSARKSLKKMQPTE